MENQTIELMVDAEVDTPGPQAPARGHSYLISVTRYKILRTINGNYANELLLVGHDDADMNSPEFQPGIRKRLELTSKCPLHATYLNPFTLENPDLFVYYCVRDQLIVDSDLN